MSDTIHHTVCHKGDAVEVNIDSLQALGVPVVAVGACVGADTCLGSRVSNTSALCPVASSSAAYRGGRGSLDGSRRRGGLGGAGGRDGFGGAGGRDGLGAGRDGLGAGRYLAGRGGDGTSGSIGGTDGAELDVGVGDRRVGDRDFDISWDTGGGGACSTGDTRGSWITGNGVAGIEPEEVGRMVIPDGHDEDNTLGEGLVHRGESTFSGKLVIITESGLLGDAEVGGDRVIRGVDSGDVDLGVLDDNVVLDIDTADFLEGSSISSISSQELGNDGDLLGSIDNLAGSVEGGVTHAVRVEIASILVADTSVVV